MQNNPRLLFLAALLIFIAITTGFILSSRHIKTSANNPSHPDSFMTNVHAIKINEFGKQRYLLISPKTTNYLKNNTTIFESPFFIINNDNEPPWHIKAVNGKTLQGIDKVILWDNVTIRQLPGKNSRNIKLITSKLIIYPNKSFVETNKPVTISQPGSIVHAVGMQADLNKNYIKLLSKTHGQYGGKIQSP